MRRDLAIVPEGTTEDKLIELWVRLKKSPHTQRAYRRDVEVFRAFVEKSLASVTLEDALDFCDNLDELEITNKRGDVKPLEDNSKRRIINSVKSLRVHLWSLPSHRHGRGQATLGQKCHLPAHLARSGRPQNDP